MESKDQETNIVDSHELYVYKHIFDLISTLSPEEVARTLTTEILALEKQTVIDNLTDLYNSQGFNNAFSLVLEELTKKNQTNNAPLGYLFFLDGDHLKSINDTYGHSEGSKAIMFLADILKKTLGTKMLGRFGGDEFVGFIQKLDAVEALTAMEIIRQTFIEQRDPRFDNLTLSIGIVPCYKGEDPQKLIKQADTAMYEAKKDRNRTVISGVNQEDQIKINQFISQSHLEGSVSLSEKVIVK